MNNKPCGCGAGKTIELWRWRKTIKMMVVAMVWGKNNRNAVVVVVAWEESNRYVVMLVEVEGKN